MTIENEIRNRLGLPRRNSTYGGAAAATDDYSVWFAEKLRSVECDLSRLRARIRSEENWEPSAEDLVRSRMRLPRKTDMHDGAAGVIARFASASHDPLPSHAYQFIDEDSIRMRLGLPRKTLTGEKQAAQSHDSLEDQIRFRLGLPRRTP